MFERNTTVKSETHDNKKGFRIIIKNLDNGEEVVNSVTKAIIGAYAGENQRGGVEANRIVLTSCNTSTLIGTIEAADKAISETKKKVIEGLPPEVLLAALLSGGSRE